jgi:hypothetical protein
MSTYYASFQKFTDAQAALMELVDGGVGSDDLSLIACLQGDEGFGSELTELPSTVGDATSFVGRTDDPSHLSPTIHPLDVSYLTTQEASRVTPVDTSDPATDVESLDQMEDSQNEEELEFSPRLGISHSTHEVDDLALTVLTGFPTSGGRDDDVGPGETGLDDQTSESLERLVIPGVGQVMGGGTLATAALDLVNQSEAYGSHDLTESLLGDGVPKGVALDLQARYANGQALIAVLITPGVLNEEAVEELAERHGGESIGLFDGPRF